MDANLRVLHVLASVSPARGGPSAVMRSMAKALHRRGVTVDVATTNDHGDTGLLDVPLEEFLPFEGGRVRYFPRQTLKYAASYSMLRWLRENVRRYDLVHTHGLFSFAPLAAAWQARAAGIPYIMRPAGVLDTWGMKNKSRIVKATSVRLLEGPLLGGAAAVHFMTELEHSRAARLPLSIKPIVLPLGFEFDPGMSPVPASDPLEDFSIGDRPVILYLARLHPVKCVDALLRAFAALPKRSSTVLLIAGEGEAQFVNSLKQLADELGLGEDVKWLGFASGARKHYLLSRATVFALPSASENFGVAVVEAMNAGLPVVVTNGCGLADLVKTAGAGLVTDGTVDGLRGALEGLLGDASLRLQMGRAGRAVVDRELSLNSFGARLESLYRSLLDGRESHQTLITPELGS